MVNAFDIVIVGGGAVGLSLALKLSKTSQYNILIVEARDLTGGSTVDRSMALSLSSQKFYESLDLWSMLSAQASAIETVHVSMQHHYGTTRIHAKQYDAPALGYVLPLSHLENTLMRAISRCSNVTLWSNTKLLSVQTDSLPKLTLSQENKSIEIGATLLVGTDGAASQVAKSAGISYQQTQYGHVAIICHLEVSCHHEGIAYERFTQDGALAFLPFGNKRVTFVWTVSTENAKKLLALTDTEYLQAALQAFGYRLGQFKSCTPRVSFPLIQSIANQQWVGQTALIGNSAHTMHPIAAQGLNLSLRDVTAFTRVIDGELTSSILSQSYLKAIAADQKKIIWMTDQIAKQVSSPRFPGWVKAFLLVGLDGFTPVKHSFSRLTMGLSA
jgi:2-octaprenyl-6-methoxyphenol hydroxylase